MKIYIKVYIAAMLSHPQPVYNCMHDIIKI